MHFVDNVFKWAYAHSFAHSYVVPCIPNYSIKHKSFVYTQLNDQTVLFQTI